MIQRLQNGVCVLLIFKWGHATPRSLQSGFDFLFWKSPIIKNGHTKSQDNATDWLKISLKISTDHLWTLRMTTEWFCFCLEFSTYLISKYFKYDIITDWFCNFVGNHHWPAMNSENDYRLVWIFLGNSAVNSHQHGE